MTASDFYDWKRHPVTQQVFAQLEDRVKQLIEQVIDQTPFMSQSEMSEKTGAIKATRDLLSIEFDEETHGN